MNKPMNFIHLAYDKLQELTAVCTMGDDTDKTFADSDLDSTYMIQCLEQPALKHVILCDNDTHDVVTYHNVRMTKAIWESSILVSRSFDKIGIANVPDEYADDKIIGQSWLSVKCSYLSKNRNTSLPSIHIRPSTTSSGYLDILIPNKGAEFLHDKLTHDDTPGHNKAYAFILDVFVYYVVINRVLLSNSGKYHKTGSKMAKPSILSMTKRSLPGKVSLKNIDIDIDAFIVDHPPKKHDETSDAVAKIWHCPAWEVRGHYRHYKSGKVVFINPYTKGKLRNQGALGREYDLHNCCK